jgi:AcrR family transcriptional regulator
VPRPRSFDAEQVVDAALEQFWGGSFATTSTDDLCASTGLSRSSLYNAFQGKADLYRQSLLRYAELKDAERRCYAERAGSGRERLTALLTDVLAGQQEFADRRSCLIVNAAVELGRSDETVARLARESLLAFRNLMAELISDGQADGSVRKDRSAGELAVVVHAMLNGLQVAARVGDPEPAGRAVDTLLALL